MKFLDEKNRHLFPALLKPVAVFVAGGLVIHLIVMSLDYFLLTGPLYLNLRENFSESIFSIAMLPMMGTYGMFSIAVYFMWARMKKAMQLAHAEEMKSQKAEVVLQSMQRITGILAEHIAMHNAEMMHWVEFSKRNGRPVSDRIEIPCNKIANALHSLSEISFVFPYTKNRPYDVTDIEKILQDKLIETKGLQAKKIINT